MIIEINKNTVTFITIGLIILIAVIITIAANPGSEAASKEILNSNKNSISSSLSTDDTNINEQTAVMGAVEVDVSVKKLGSDEVSNIFSVSFNTHSVDLDFDFTEIILLRDNLGNNYQATEWTGNRGWHHVSGEIIFPAIDSKASEVVLTITEIESMEKSFKWTVDN